MQLLTTVKKNLYYIQTDRQTDKFNVFPGKY